MLEIKHLKFIFLRTGTIQFNTFESWIIKVSHSSNFLYQGFVKKSFLGIYLHSKLKLKTKKKIGGQCAFY